MFGILVVSLHHSYFSYVIECIHINVIAHVICLDCHKSIFILSEFCDFEMKFLCYIVVLISLLLLMWDVVSTVIIGYIQHVP